MSDLIDKEVLYNHFADLEAIALGQVEKYMYDEDLSEWHKWSAILQERTAYKYDVFGAPTVDAEPVVRCKDCKWFNGTEGENPFSNVAFCDLDNNLVRFVDDNDFCSRGERREG